MLVGRECDFRSCYFLTGGGTNPTHNRLLIDKDGNFNFFNGEVLFGGNIKAKIDGEDKFIISDDGKVKILGELSINTQNNHPFNASIYFPKTEDKHGSIINTFIDLT